MDNGKKTIWGVRGGTTLGRTSTRILTRNCAGGGKKKMRKSKKNFSGVIQASGLIVEGKAGPGKWQCAGPANTNTGEGYVFFFLLRVKPQVSE